MAIRIRYGQDGNLLTAAAMAAGTQAQSQYLNRQKDRDFAFLTDELSRRARAAEVSAANEMEGRRLQMAHEQFLASRPAATATSQNFMRGGDNAIARSVKKAAMDSAMARGVTGSQAETLRLMEGRGEVDATAFDKLAEQYADEAEKQKDRLTKETKAKGAQESKTAFVNQLPETMRAEFAPFVDDENVSLSQLRIAAGVETGRVASAAKTQKAAEISMIDKEIALMERRMKDAVKSLEQQYESRFEEVPSGMREQMMFMHRQSINRLLEQKGKLVNEMGATTTATPGAKPLDATTAAKFLATAGGDKTKARQLAVQSGYTF